jgi:hypothetical protein
MSTYDSLEHHNPSVFFIQRLQLLFSDISNDNETDMIID